MGNSSYTIGTALKNYILDFFSDFSHATYSILSLIVLSLFSFLLTVVYKKVRRKFPVKVNCWFCNNNTTVPFDSFNCWDCPHCNQYNGFNKDGDYNKIIPEQYDYKLNETTFTTSKGSSSSDNNLQSSGFCKLCNINQQLKIQQLALFMPVDESNYCTEIEQYREKLEKAYKLCSKCEKTLQETLEKQEYNILTNRLNYHKLTTLSQKEVDKFGRWNILALMKKNTESGLKVICIVVITVLFLALLNHFETENQFLYLSLPDFGIVEPLIPIVKVLQSYAVKIHSLKRELSFAGLIFWFFADFYNQIGKSHVCLIVWAFLHILLWTSFTGAQVFLSGICLVLTVQATHSKFIYLYKKSLPKKMGFQPVKKVFPESFSTLTENRLPESAMLFPTLRNESLSSFNLDNNPENKAKEREQKLTDRSDCRERKKKLRRRENEIESLPNEEKEKPDSKIPNASPADSPTASFVEADKNCEANGPFNEVYNTLNSLHLGGKKRKSNKPPNFLFSNHNFSEMKGTSSSIIKPAKLVKNLSSTSWTESNECNSRSSTPSSGYSSQKPDKQEPSRYDFSKTSTPLFLSSFTRPSPNNYYDHFEGNHLFYNNMNCFSPGFVPFQQYPGPMGHTAIYTCTRPTNFPFSFPPYQGFSAQKFSPGSSRYSDSSDCYNLFQDSSRSFEKNRKWCKFKSFLYYLSIFLNIATVMSLFFFMSTGVVLVDWQLPKFNFFV